jgi:hypothetical protein
LRKLRYDAFYGTPLDHLLRCWGVDTLVICGTVLTSTAAALVAGSSPREMSVAGWMWPSRRAIQRLR